MIYVFVFLTNGKTHWLPIEQRAPKIDQGSRYYHVF
uniref:Uncharacterized protein n=1 Tax=Brassica campestris TaxID=3711 RepID=A0A3P5ZR63_BRACM|nr:unnamed protein product [Brassica rapa]